MTPDSCHVLVAGGVTFFIDGETRKEVELFLKSDHQGPMLLVDSICGEEITVIRGYVQVVHSTTPETREADRALGKLFTLEDPIE